ncbi:MAG TPA: aconitate hydratase [bacterium]|nr:aconitate hydratase [bacterium]
MADSLTYQILRRHLMEGTLAPGQEIGIRIDQTLTQDATGTMAYLQFEALGLDRVKTELSVSYVDHNMLQTGYENADDHRYLQSVAAKFGIFYSRPGNGICHQVHLERFARPGATLLGSDSHTPTAGGMGSLAIGAGGLDVAVAMAGAPFFLAAPEVLGVELRGQLQPWVTAKDIILEVLRRLSVRGGVGKVIEYYGPGVRTLTVPERATITNMGAELGATTSIFPSDDRTRTYLQAQGRGGVYQAIGPEKDAEYHHHMVINLNELEPLMAAPHSPDNIVTVREVEGTPVDQVCVGSCTNSSYHDLKIVAYALSGKRVHPRVSMTVTPGSQQVFEQIANDGALKDMIAAGCRILESACGPCIGMGQAPPSGGVSIRSFNRNFLGRSGTKDAQVYLASPETCVASALLGKIADPRRIGAYPKLEQPRKFIINDRQILAPAKDPAMVEVLRGPNIQPLPINDALANNFKAEVILKVGDNITTDHILPAGAKILPLRSNIPAISEYTYSVIDPTFAERARLAKKSVIVGGENYGQGSSREHAALAPMYLGVKAVIVKSFARIHKANLINFGIIPLVFGDPEDLTRIQQGDKLELKEVRASLENGTPIRVRNLTQRISFTARYDLTERERQILLAGGKLNHVRLLNQKAAEEAAALAAIPPPKASKSKKKPVAVKK